jgi:hypothetical protein
MRIKYKTEEIDNIINKFKECNSYEETSLCFNIPVSSCKSILNRNGYFIGNRKLKLNKDKAIHLIDKCKEKLSSKKYSFSDLCDELEINSVTFKNYILQNKIKGIIEVCSPSNKKKTALSYNIKDKIIELEKEGKGNDVIGKILEIDGATVRRYLIEYYGEDKYKERHSIDKFKTPLYSGFVNKRGDRFHSTLEMLVADYLYECNIKYKTQDYIKFPNGKFIYPDFYLEKYNTYIEVFGMSEVPYYIESMNNKINLYNENNINLIGLFYKNFRENNWKEILNYKLNIEQNEKRSINF